MLLKKLIIDYLTQQVYSIIMCNNDELFSVSDFFVCEESGKCSSPEIEAQKQHEIHTMMGLLRFTPDKNGEFTAKCAPDHYILPNLTEYFTARFGETPWSIIDEKRGLRLRRLPGENAKISPFEDNNYANEKENGADNRCIEKNDQWEELWKHYHKTINNEDRNNPDLQRQLMPKRYWKYLPEKGD